MQAYLIIQPGRAYERANLQKLRSYRLMFALKKSSYKWKPKGVHSWLGYLQCTEQAILVYRVWMVHYGEKMVTSRRNCWVWSAMIISMDSGDDRTRERMCAPSLLSPNTLTTNQLAQLHTLVRFLRLSGFYLQADVPFQRHSHFPKFSIHGKTPFFVFFFALHYTSALKATIKPPALLSTISAC